MVRLYEQDLVPIWEIAQRLGRGQGTVHRYLRQLGVQMRPHGQNARPSVRRIPHAQVERAVELYRSGMSQREVGERLGLRQSAVRYRLDIAGVERRSASDAQKLSNWRHPRRLVAGVEARVAEMYRSGVLLEDIARETGVYRTTVSDVAKRNGVPLRRPSKQEPPASLAGPVMRGGGVPKIDNTPLREAFEASSLLAGELAVRLDWLERGRPDSSRVKRALGVTQDVTRGKLTYRRLIDPEVAALMADAMGLMPWEVGA